MTHTLFSVLCWMVLNPASGAGSDLPPRDIGKKLEYFSSAGRPQKVYLHLDKSSYQAGQTIWFKAYLLDGIDHKPDRASTNLFVELINSSGKAMSMRVLLAENGFAIGDMKLNMDLPDDNYILRAYTDWMRNFDEEHYFTRHLYIGNSGYENIIPRLDVLKNRLFNRKIDRMGRNYEIAFFPEGGNLLAGVTNRVAFKIVDALGRGQEAEGEIVDRSGDIVARFETGFPGIGVFEIEPEAGNSYKARVALTGERQRDYDFPEAIEEGYALRVDDDREKIRISLHANVGTDNPLYSEEIILLGHTRGIPHFTETVRLNNNRLEATADKELFPSGITHFTAFTRDRVPIAERLIFIDRGDELAFSPRIGNVNREEDYFDFHLRVNDHNGDPVEGTFSLSAVTGQPGKDSHSTDILSYILLGSDLKGMVENPQAYLHPTSEQAITADHLLLTYGWRRFNWDDVLAGNTPDIKYSPEPGLTLAGRLMDPAKNESLNNYPVKLMVRSGHDDLYEANTARNGLFSFSGLFYDGVIQVELSSRRLPANYPPAIELNVRGGSGFSYEPGIYTEKLRITGRGDNWRRKRGASATPYASAPQRQVNPQLYGVPDQTIFIDYDLSTEKSLYEVLRNRATGLSFDGGQIIIRGPSSLFSSNEARFMLDGMFVDRNAFLSLYPREIERIEIFRGTSAAIFGVRGGTGVILAYTRRPAYKGFEDVMELSMMGYHEPSEFYSDLISIPGITYDATTERTVFWEPDLITGEDGVVELRLPFNHGINRLKFTIEGAGFDGGLGFARFTLDIEQ